MSDQPKSPDAPLPKTDAAGHAEEPKSDPPQDPAPASPPAAAERVDPVLLDAEPDSQLDPRNEEDLWQGRASWKSIYASLLLWLLITLVVTLGIGFISNWKYTNWALGVCGLYLLYLLGRHAYQVWSVSYKLSTQRLFIRRGILTQTVDQTELMRVDDVKITQTLIERLVGIGLVEVMASDRSDASLFIRSIADPEQVAEHIRRHTRMLQRRTLFMEQL